MKWQVLLLSFLVSFQLFALDQYRLSQKRLEERVPEIRVEQMEGEDEYGNRCVVGLSFDSVVSKSGELNTLSATPTTYWFVIYNEKMDHGTCFNWGGSDRCNYHGIHHQGQNIGELNGYGSNRIAGNRRIGGIYQRIRADRTQKKSGNTISNFRPNRSIALSSGGPGS